MSVAAVLIARNSTATIERLFDSIRAHVDEICVYLGGESTDGTPELLARLAREPGAPIHVKQGAWTSYADARNAADAMASSEYLMWFDDDEVLEGGEHLRAQVLAERPDVLCVRRVDVMEVQRVFLAFRPQVVKAALLGGRWVGAIHEHHDPSVLASARHRVAHPALVRKIHAPVKAPGRHWHRDLVESTFARTGERRLGLYVAQHLSGDDSDDEAAAAVLRALVAAPWPPEDSSYVRQAYDHLGGCLVRLGDMDGAAAAFESHDELHREWERDPFVRSINALHRAFPILPSDPLWRTYADDARMADAHNRRDAR